MSPVRPTNQGTRGPDSQTYLLCTVIPAVATDDWFLHIYKWAGNSGNFIYCYMYSIKQVKMWARNHSFQQTVGVEQCSVWRAELGFSSRAVDAGVQCTGERLGCHQFTGMSLHCCCTNAGVGPIPPALLPSFPHQDRTPCGFQPSAKISSERSQVCWQWDTASIMLALANRQRLDDGNFALHI